MVDSVSGKIDKSCEISLEGLVKRSRTCLLDLITGTNVTGDLSKRVVISKDPTCKLEAHLLLLTVVFFGCK